MRQKFKQLRSFYTSHVKSAFVTNSSWIVVEQIYRMGLSLIVGVLTARYLGPSNLGLITYAATYVAAFMPLATLSMEYVVIKDLVDRPKQAGEILGSGIFMRIISGFISLVFIIAFVTILKPGDQTYIVVTALNSLSLIAGAFTLVDCWLQAQLRSKYATIIKSVGYTCMSLYKVYLLATHKSVLWFAFATSLDLIIIAGLYVYLLLVKNKLNLTINKSTMKHLIQQSYPFIITGLMIVVYGQLDRLFLEYYHGEKALGLYGVGSNLSYIWQFIPAAIITSARPLILAAKNNQNGNYMKRLKQLYAFIWWLSVTVAVFFSIFSDLVVKILYGSEYAGAAIVLKIISWSQGFSLLGGARSIWLLAENKNKYLVPSQIISAIFSVTVNLLLIPVYGAIGAAISMLLTQIFVALISTLFMKQTRESTRIILDAILLKGVR